MTTITPGNTSCRLSILALGKPGQVPASRCLGFLIREMETPRPSPCRAW